MVTITQVAKLAGVAPSTVSHVLNGKRPISTETKKRVLKIIDELGYIPNPNAQALKSKKTGIIGFIAHDITESFVTRILRGVEKVICDNGSYLAIVSGAEFNFDINKAIKFLNKRRLDGIIVSYEITMKDPLSGLPELTIPIVTINRATDKKHYSVLPDNICGGYQAGKHLLAAGCKCPAMIAAQKSRFASEERKMGFLKALEESNKEVDKTPIYYGDFSYTTGVRGLDALLKENPKIDGLFCANDYIAMGALHNALQKRITIPDEMKIIGYDNRDFSSFGPIPITTFSQPLEKMGEISGGILLDLIDGKLPSKKRYYLKSTLLPRKSTIIMES